MRMFMKVLVVLGLILSPLCRMLPAEDAKNTKIGVVDLRKIFDNYKKKMDQEVELEKEKNELQSELDKKEKELKSLEKEMEILEGEEKLKKKSEFDDKRKEYTAFYSYNNKKLQKKQVDLWNDTYNEIIEEVKRFGEKGEYDLILKANNEPIRGKTLEEIQLRVDIKDVLLHSPKVDLTDAIIKTLNDRHKRLKESREKSS
ncbi:OmpH family outer membrane protein [Planctomycetota bacterium]